MEQLCSVSYWEFLQVPASALFAARTLPGPCSQAGAALCWLPCQLGASQISPVGGAGGRREVGGKERPGVCCLSHGSRSLCTGVLCGLCHARRTWTPGAEHPPSRPGARPPLALTNPHGVRCPRLPAWLPTSSVTYTTCSLYRFSQLHS